MVVQCRVVNMGLELGLHTKTGEQRRRGVLQGMDTQMGDAVAVAVALALAIAMLMAMAMAMMMGWAVQREQLKNLGDTSLSLSLFFSFLFL